MTSIERKRKINVSSAQDNTHNSEKPRSQTQLGNQSYIDLEKFVKVHTPKPQKHTVYVLDFGSLNDITEPKINGIFVSQGYVAYTYFKTSLIKLSTRIVKSKMGDKTIGKVGYQVRFGMILSI